MTTVLNRQSSEASSNVSDLQINVTKPDRAIYGQQTKCPCPCTLCHSVRVVALHVTRDHGMTVIDVTQ
jgi:hypothetical protein